MNKKQKDAIWGRDKSICQRCGIQLRKDFQQDAEVKYSDCIIRGGVVHHKNGDGWKYNADLDKIILLCGKCHREIHRIATQSENALIGLKSKRPSLNEIEEALKYVHFDYSVTQEEIIRAIELYECQSEEDAR